GVERGLAAMLQRKENIAAGLTDGIGLLFRKNKVTRYFGRGRLTGGTSLVVEGEEGTTEIEAKHIVIATGSKVATLKGVELDGDRIGTSTEALSYPEVPKHLVVIGA